MTTKIKEQRYREAANSYLGWCTTCKKFTRDMTEPDAEEYDCPVCEENTVPGRFFSISQDPAIPGWPLTNDSALEMAEKIEKGYGMEPPDNLEIA